MSKSIKDKVSEAQAHLDGIRDLSHPDPVLRAVRLQQEVLSELVGTEVPVKADKRPAKTKTAAPAR